MNLDLITSEEFSKAVGVAPGTLANWRCTGLVKIPYIKIGAHVRYRRSDIERWLEQQVVHATGTTAAVNE